MLNICLVLVFDQVGIHLPQHPGHHFRICPGNAEGSDRLRVSQGSLQSAAELGDTLCGKNVLIFV